MNKYKKQVDKLLDICETTLKLLSEYKKAGLSLPFGLKGNIGEFLVTTELMKRFPNSEIDFKGGAYPGVDVIINNKKIQIKTSFDGNKKLFSKNGVVELEGCPTIKKDTIKYKRCDFIVFVVLYLSHNLLKIKKRNIYIFSRKDFHNFSTVLCWSGKSRGDYTIANIIKVKGGLPKKLSKNIAFYNTPKYKNIFKSSKNKWSKIFAE